MMLKAPFPYFGGKSSVAGRVWGALGDVRHYMEPFFGSGAVLLARPGYDYRRHIETICDRDGHLCLAPEVRVLTDELYWKPIGECQEGDKLLSFDEYNDGPRFKRAPSGYRHWRIATVLATRRVVKDCYRLRFSDGVEIICSGDHQWLGGKNCGLRWLTTKNWYSTINRRDQKAWVLKVVDVAERKDDYEHGWLGGMADGEGHYHGAAHGGGGNWCISIHQAQGAVANHVVALLHKYGYPIRIDVKERHGYKTMWSIHIAGGMSSTFRFLMETRPRRLIENFLKGIEKKSIYTRSKRYVYIEEMEHIGKREVVALETDTHTYIAEGFASHNCNVWRSLQFSPDEVARWCDWPINHCVPSGTSIETPHGRVDIDRLKVGDIVFGEKNGCIVPTLVTGTYSGISDSLGRVGSLYSTMEHPYWVEDSGYKPLSELQVGDKVAIFDWHINNVEPSIKLGVLYDAEMGNLCSTRSCYESISLCGSNKPQPKTTISGTHSSSEARKSSLCMLLDKKTPKPVFDANISNSGNWLWYGMARCRTELDSHLQTTRRRINKSDRRRGWCAWVESIYGNKENVVFETEGYSLSSRTYFGDAWKASYHRSSLENIYSGDWSQADAGTDFEDCKRKARKATIRGAQTKNSDCAQGEKAYTTAQGQDCVENEESETCRLHRNRHQVRFDNPCCSNSARKRGCCVSGNTQGILLQKQPLRICVRVFNIETETGNYFAEGILVHNCDLVARREALIHNEGRLLENLCKDDMWHDPKMAGYWIWAASCWIGGGMLKKEQRRRPDLGSGKGVHKLSAIPHLGNGGMGVHRLSFRDEGAGDTVIKDVTEPYSTSIYTWFRDLSERLRHVRVVCGDWSRICGGNWQNNVGSRDVGIFFDPPYGSTHRDTNLYHCDSMDVAKQVMTWCLERGKLPDYRIVLAGYDDEHQELIDHGWTVERWVAGGGYGNTARDGKDSKGKQNRHRECLWYSPNCLVNKDTGLFNKE